LSPSKATGPDGIPAYLLQRCSEVIAPSLTVLFELSLQQGVFPSEWKSANVVPIPKKGDAHEVTNYRPVSLLSQVSKVLERLIFRQVSSFIKDSLYDIQHGFRCNRSCVTQLLNVFHNLGRALDSDNEIDLLYLDFAKAFDSVSHSELLFILKSFGISGQLLNWFADYLHNRKQRVIIVVCFLVTSALSCLFASHLQPLASKENISGGIPLVRFCQMVCSYIIVIFFYPCNIKICTINIQH
jgi:hypothetical protein